MKILDMIKDVKSEFKPIPFWSWNDKLNTDMLKWQIGEMNKAGIGGFFMHARSGLKTQYLGDEWLDCTRECIDEANRLGMNAWCYDENGWPSGSADGKVSKVNESYHMRWLSVEKTNHFINDNNVLGTYIIKDGNAIRVNNPALSDEYIVIRCESSHYYVDLLNKDCIAEFINQTHQKYKDNLPEYFDGRLCGFFTDEPQFKRSEIPWSTVIPNEFREKYGYDILDVLPAIFFEVDGYKKVRYDFWNLVSQLFTNSFMKQINEWCEKNNTKLTGHLMMEDNLYCQMAATAGVMPSYEYMHIPGMDWLGRKISTPVIPKQVSSVAEQLGITKTISETFALCGWGVTFEELKWIAQWQFVNGINMLCQHLEGYTLAGLRKRDYPPGMFYQQPWWEQYKMFNDYFSRLGVLLREGEGTENVLYIHPIKSAYIHFDGSGESVKELDEAFSSLAVTLSAMHIGWHFGDETIMAKHASVQGDTLKIGKCKYKAVVLSKCDTLDNTTIELLIEFAKNGGEIFTENVPSLCEGAPDNRLSSYITLTTDLKNALKKHQLVSITENGEEATDIECVVKNYGNRKLIYMVNMSKTMSHTCKIATEDNVRILSLEDMQLQAIPDINNLLFEPMQSYILVTDVKDKTEPITQNNVIKLEGELNIENVDYNSLTLDFCEYKIGKGEWQTKIAVINLMDQLIDNRINDDVELKFTFESKVELDECYAVIEKPNLFDISINGEKIVYNDCGWWIDSEFKKVDIGGKIKIGKNEIVLKCKFYQNQNVYDVLLGVGVHESEKNKLTLDIEFESIYIIGNFGVFNTSKFTEGERNSLFSSENFFIDNLPTTVSSGDFTEQGFAFFAGKITVSKNTSEQSGVIDLSEMNAPVASVAVNDKYIKTIAWAPFTVDITNYLEKGTDNKISVSLYSSCRNLLGPHHHVIGELHDVGTSSFGSKPGWCEQAYDTIWRDDGYCFIKFGL